MVPIWYRGMGQAWMITGHGDIALYIKSWERLKRYNGSCEYQGLLMDKQKQMIDFFLGIRDLHGSN